MKRKIMSLLVALCLALALFPAVPAAAAAPVNVTINGVPVQFNQSTGIPFIDSNGRTQVPLRAAMEAMGADVGWNNDVRAASVVKNGYCVIIPIGEKCVYSNGEKFENDTTAQIINGRTYLPIRAVAEGLNLEVTWIGATRTVDIYDFGSRNGLYLTSLLDEPLNSVYSLFGYNCKESQNNDGTILSLKYDNSDLQFILDKRANNEAKVMAIISEGDFCLWDSLINRHILGELFDDENSWDLSGQMSVNEINQCLNQSPNIKSKSIDMDGKYGLMLTISDLDTPRYIIIYVWDSLVQPISPDKSSCAVLTSAEKAKDILSNI